MRKFFHLSALLITFTLLSNHYLLAQNVGINTDTPDAPFHVSSSGQVQTPGGLILLGNRSEGHMELDMNKIQSLFGVGETPLPLLLQQLGGDVGIGTLAPASRLHIEGFDDQFMTLRKIAVGAGGVGIDFIRGNDFNGTDWRIFNDGGKLKFYDGLDNFNTVGDLNLTITAAGNVGIGTDSPSSELDIEGTDDQFLTLHKTVSGAGVVGINLLRGNEFSATDWQVTNDGGVFKISQAADNFETTGNEHLRISASGNVGIGTENPHTKLHVDGGEPISETGHGDLQIGDGSGSHLRFDNNEILARNGDNPSTLYLQYWSGNLSLAYNNLGRVGVGTFSPQAKLHVTDGTDVNFGGGGQLVLGPTSGENMAFDGNEILARDNGVEAPLFLQISGGDVLMVPNENGQVGIGVTSMANMPGDEYLLAVDGKIISEEVRVEISGSWPDYVFQDDYDMLSLDELEGEINQLGHLPGIPSANEVETDGFELGDMQRRVMEKIEELTLYMIDANKQIQDLKKENAALKARVDLLER